MERLFFCYMQLNNPKVIRAWCLFDWANSVYSLVITSTIFPVYYSSVTSTAESDVVIFFGIPVTNTVLYSYSLSFSFLVIAALQPPLSGIADYTHRKKSFMKFFTWLGSIACMGLFFFTGENVEFGIMCSVLASIGYAGSIVFYNSFLPEIASYDQYDRVSARGFSWGYIGSVLLLIVNLFMIQKPEWFGLEAGSLPARVSFLMTGLWWIGFSQITFYYLPKAPDRKPITRDYVLKGYREIRMVLKSLKQLPELKKYLLAFFFYNMGVQTVMYLAALFGDKELKLSADKLILTVLIIQLVGIAGSHLFARLSEWKGNKMSLTTMVLIWVAVCIAAYYVSNEYQFYALAFCVGMIMGGIQALSRATYSKLIPTNSDDHASYFSFYDVTYNVSVVFGTFSYGLIEQWTGSMRNSALALGGFFLIGLFFLTKVTIPQTEKDAYKVEPVPA